MSEARNIDVLNRVIRYCNEIEEAITQCGSSVKALRDNSMYRNASAMCILQIGELTTHLTDEFKAVYPDVPWQEIKRMRNIAAHHYGSFDMEKLLETMTEDIPSLKDYCQSIVNQYEIMLQDAVDEPTEEPDMTM